jgi:hypothetical protein
MAATTNSSNKATRKNKLAPERKPYRVWFDNQAIIKKINKDAAASLKRKVDAFQQQKIQGD